MKIALVTSSFLPHIGGAEFVVHNLAVQWAKQGHEVCVINSFTDQATHANGFYKVMKYNLLRGSTRFGYHRFPFGIYATNNLKKCISKFDPDFISAHFGYPVGCWLRKIDLNCKYLITCHGPAIVDSSGSARDKYKFDSLIADSLNKSDGAVAISTAVRKIMESMGVGSSKIIDISNGVDVDRFTADVNFNLRQTLGIPDDGMVILSVGRQSVQKGYEDGIRAFFKVLKNNPNAYYVIVGRGVSCLNQLTESLEISSNVILNDGFQGDELVGAYQQADIFFSPSLWELCPLVVLEAMASGLPVVATDVSGSQDLITSEKNGFLTRKGDIVTMYSFLAKLVSDPILRKQFSEQNTILAKIYSWDSISRKYLECI